MAEYSAYCMKCKETHPIKDATVVTMKNGVTRAAKGTCAKNGNGMYGILKKDA